ncbi:hypothetical protein CLAFUW4_00908 [Fulvia fulva]|nr:hypothetical protein CLAFUR4_00909 [Fulvia fulva]WPV09763.1 hypothetical protein CLAFUW4_00908 [Fulvia fulva]WPV23468.1 hypothetical protein CLAFUW7_00908 [Fulvia fulva]
MVITTKATIAWATPVRPDQLGEALEAYSKAAPTLHTLRLCHRFGRGPKVHVTRLPAEIELAIEALLLKAAKHQIATDLWDSGDPLTATWSEAFHHFEGKCAPMDHMPDIYSPLNDQAFDDPMSFCGPCDDHEYFNTDKCQKALVDRMNDLFLAWEHEWDEEYCGGWRERIDPAGGFAKYAAVLHRHFGLNVHFVETRFAQEDDASWPRLLNHRYHTFEKLKTTLCYLTLAPRPVAAKRFELSDIETEIGTACVSAAQAVTVPRQDLSDMCESENLKFRRAMNVLGLRPYRHPSQRGLLKDAPMPAKATTTGHDLDAMGQTWPQLTFIFQAEWIA